MSIPSEPTLDGLRHVRYPTPGAERGFGAAEALLLRQGTIAEIQADGRRAGALPTALDCRGCTVLPGFIDVHIHGADGHDSMDATPAALDAMRRFLPRYGVSAFYPTTMTAPPAATLDAVANVARVDGRRPGARILGVHLEGPFISPQYPGAQHSEAIRDPDPIEFEEWLAGGPVALITLAPERPGADGLIAMARSAGVEVVMGHTAATYDQALAAVENGVRQATHTFNAMTGLHHRRPGTVGAILRDERIYAQLIADNIHVHPAAMDILARCKGTGGVLLISDAIRATGLPPGEYELGGQGVTVRNGECRLADGTLAGSVLTLDRALRNFMAASGWSLAEAWPVTSRNQARALGIADRYGSVAVGYQADLVVLDDDHEVVATIVDGRLVYLREGEQGRLSAGAGSRTVA